MSKYWQVYQTPQGDWGGAADGLIFDGYCTELGATQRAADVLEQRLQTLAREQDVDRKIGEAVMAALSGLTNPDDLRLTAQSHWRAGFQFAAAILDAIANTLERER